MSNSYKQIEQRVLRDVMVRKTCDVCHKDIPPAATGFAATKHPYFSITTHHCDWGNDSIDSFDYYDACSPECALKFISDYLTNDFTGRHSRTIEIEHKNYWKMPSETAYEGKVDD